MEGQRRLSSTGEGIMIMLGNTTLTNLMAGYNDRYAMNGYTGDGGSGRLFDQQYGRYWYALIALDIAYWDLHHGLEAAGM